MHRITRINWPINLCMALEWPAFAVELRQGWDDDRELEPLVDAGATIGLEHQWSFSLYSVFVYNWAVLTILQGQPSNAVLTTDYFAVDLQWRFAERAMAGG